MDNQCIRMDLNSKIKTTVGVQTFVPLWCLHNNAASILLSQQQCDFVAAAVSQQSKKTENCQIKPSQKLSKQNNPHRVKFFEFRVR